MRLYPALDVCGAGRASGDIDADAILVAVDDYAPTAVEERERGLRVFFTSPDARDAACAELRRGGFQTDPLDVSDEDWARRSQADLQAVRVGRFVVEPRRAAPRSHDTSDDGSGDGLTIVVPPSMGFGTGHHATTRLCLDMLQRIAVSGRSVVDVGTGSGVLAIAADLLGAARVLGIDCDEDAIRCARENLTLNPGARHTTFAVADLGACALPASDVVTANLTGALLVRCADRLQRAAGPGGALVLSGILAAERDDVVRAFARDLRIEHEGRDGEWVGLLVTKT
jgi:ribosomal protein L11 methyltransferase